MNQYFTTYISIIVSSLTILSYLLALNEYYENKAYWDFFHINRKIRTNMRSGFHAEYLSYALVITGFFLIVDGCLVYFQKQVKNTYLFLLYYSAICFILFIIVFIVLYFIIRKFSLTDVNERRIWSNKKQYHQYVRKAYRLSFLKLSISYLLIVIALYFFSVNKAYYISGFLFAAAFIYLQFQNYSQRQQLIIETKWFDITRIGNETFVILAHNGDLVQMNKCSIYGKVLYINLDRAVIQRIEHISYQTIHIEKFEKICNGAICTEHYKVGYKRNFY